MAEPIRSCEVEIRVRYAEVDAMGYLHHARYWVYFELGRTELMRRNGLRYRDMEELGFFYAVAKVDCRFIVPARYDDVLTLSTTTERLTRVRVEHSYRLKRDDTLLAEANTRLVAVGRNGRPVGLPQNIFNHLSGVVTSPSAD